MRGNLIWIVDSPIIWKEELNVHNSKIIFVSNYNSFCNYIKINGLPKAINFKYTLESSKNGYDCALWLVNYCIDYNLRVPIWAINSSHPDKDKINKLLLNYNKFYDRSKSSK